MNKTIIKHKININAGIKQNKKTVYVFGNEYLEKDNFAHKVVHQLKDKVRIVSCRGPEQLLETNGEVLIMDVVKNLTRPTLIKDVDDLKTRKLISLHDFDVSFFLHLLKEVDMAKKITIIGLPEKGDKQEIANKVITWI